MHLTDDQLKQRFVDNVDIAFDELPNNKHYKKEEDPKFFKSQKTGIFYDMFKFILKIINYLNQFNFFVKIVVFWWRVGVILTNPLCVPINLWMLALRSGAYKLK